MRHRFDSWGLPARESTPLASAVTLIEAAALAALLPLALGVAGVTVGRFRGDCRQQLCAQRLGAVAAAHGVYMADSGGWFAGSPMTTGQQLWPGGSSSLPYDAVDTPGDVVQIWDWAAPMAGQLLNEPLDPNRAVRWRTQLVEGPFACPSNTYTSIPFPAPVGDWTPQRMVSYDSMREIMARGGTAPGTSPLAVSLTYFHPQVGGTEQTPYPYLPRLEHVGDPTKKVFLADGARFTDASTGSTIHSFDWQASAGGAFSSGAPTTPDAFERSYFRSSVRPDLAPRAYRHPCGAFLGLNVAFFDGHVDWMSEALSRHPDFWWPSDTVLPLTEMNIDTRNLVLDRLTTERPTWWGSGSVPLHYRVR